MTIVPETQESNNNTNTSQVKFLNPYANWNLQPKLPAWSKDWTDDEKWMYIQAYNGQDFATQPGTRAHQIVQSGYKQSQTDTASDIVKGIEDNSLTGTSFVGIKDVINLMNRIGKGKSTTYTDPEAGEKIEIPTYIQRAVNMDNGITTTNALAGLGAVSMAAPTLTAPIWTIAGLHDLATNAGPSVIESAKNVINNPVFFDPRKKGGWIDRVFHVGDLVKNLGLSAFDLLGLGTGVKAGAKLAKQGVNQMNKAVKVANSVAKKAVNYTANQIANNNYLTSQTLPINQTLTIPKEGQILQTPLEQTSFSIGNNSKLKIIKEGPINISNRAVGPQQKVIRYHLENKPDEAFELSLNEKNPNTFNINFKTSSADALTAEEKDAIFDYLANSLPEGYSITVAGNGITPGAIHGLNRFGDMGWEQQPFTSLAFDENNQVVRMPIFKKPLSTIQNSESLLKRWSSVGNGGLSSTDFKPYEQAAIDRQNSKAAEKAYNEDMAELKSYFLDDSKNINDIISYATNSGLGPDAIKPLLTAMGLKTIRARMPFAKQSFDTQLEDIFKNSVRSRYSGQPELNVTYTTDNLGKDVFGNYDANTGAIQVRIDTPTMFPGLTTFHEGNHKFTQGYLKNNPYYAWKYRNLFNSNANPAIKQPHETPVYLNELGLNLGLKTGQPFNQQLYNNIPNLLTKPEYQGTLYNGFNFSPENSNLIWRLMTGQYEDGGKLQKERL